MQQRIAPQRSTAGSHEAARHLDPLLRRFSSPAASLADCEAHKRRRAKTTAVGAIDHLEGWTKAAFAASVFEWAPRARPKPALGTKHSTPVERTARAAELTRRSFMIAKVCAPQQQQPFHVAPYKHPPLPRQHPSCGTSKLRPGTHRRCTTEKGRAGVEFRHVMSE